MRTLVTGGAGFIGSHIVEELLRRGDTVRVLDNFSSGTRDNLAALLGSPDPSPGKGNLEILEGDLRNTGTVRSALQDIELVFHLAAFVSVPQSMSDPETCFAVNVGGTVNLLEASRRARVRQVVLSSSTAVYGDLVGLQVKDMINSFVAGDVAKARRLHHNMMPLVNAMFVVANPCPVKYALNQVGFNVGKPRPPLIDVGEEPDPKPAQTIKDTLKKYKIDLPL